ncbi:hypothetical protein [Micromonospora andamanensis]|uniref:hypothetical protein n=1 Tax=Micromonospora andamanensis TaxID=1287068 RepID=UPI0019525FE7|nr:hypothetical protein [Micromonospora andamanensis]GIJ41676.1 hypothetical protein Vwe01_50010 [Micromonospora andamanensis]
MRGDSGPKGSRQVTVDSLFTFAQVALYQAMKTLRNEGVDVEVIAIPPAWSGKSGNGGCLDVSDPCRSVWR